MRVGANSMQCIDLHNETFCYCILCTHSSWFIYVRNAIVEIKTAYKEFSLSVSFSFVSARSNNNNKLNLYMCFVPRLEFLSYAFVCNYWNVYWTESNIHHKAHKTQKKISNSTRWSPTNGFDLLLSLQPGHAHVVITISHMFLHSQHCCQFFMLRTGKKKN